MRLKILCGLFALIFSSMGMFVVLTDVPMSVEPPAPPDNLSSTLMERPTEGDITTLDAKSNLYVAAGELARAGSFRGETTGQTVSMGVSQGVASKRAVKDDHVFKQSTSFSAFVKLGEQRYVRGTTDYIVRRADSVMSLDNAKWANTATNISKQSYSDTYGYVASGLTGYILNDSTILSAELTSTDNGLYTFHYQLDPVAATYFVLFEMRTSAGTAAFPEFAKADIFVTMDSNWQVKTVSTDCQYKVALLGGTMCSEQLTERFYDIGKIATVEEVDEYPFFSQYFGAEVGEIEQKVDPLTELMNIFQPYIQGAPLNVDLDVSKQGAIDSLISGKLNMLLDIENTDNIVVNARLNGIADIAYKQGKLFIAKDNFRASTTVDGVMSAVGTMMQLAGVGGVDLGAINLDGLLSQLKADKGDDYCTVMLDTELMGMALAAKINATINSDGTYTLDNVVANVADYQLLITPCGSWQVLDTNGNYPELLGLLDIIQDGVVALEVKLNNQYMAHVQYDIKSNQLNAQLGDINLALVDNHIVVTYGQIKLKLALQDIQLLADKILPLIEALGANSGLDVRAMNLPDINIDKLLDGLYFDSTANSAELGIDAGSLKMSAVLTVVNNRWTLDGIYGTLGEFSLQAVPTQPQTYPEVNLDEYLDIADFAPAILDRIVELAQAKQFSVAFDAELTVEEQTFRMEGNLYVSNGIEVDVRLWDNNLKILDTNIVVLDGILYLKANNLALAIRLNNTTTYGANTISAVIDALDSVKGINAHLDSVLDCVKGVLLKVNNGTLDYGSLVKELTYDSALNVVIDGEVLGTSDLTVSIGTQDNLSISIAPWQVGSVNVQLGATVTAGAPIISVNASDYQLNLVVKLDEINTIYANIDTLNNVYKFSLGEMFVEYSNNEVKIAYNDIAVKGDITQLQQIIDKLAELANSRLFQNGNKPTNTDGLNALFNIDIQQILKSLTFEKTDNGYLIGVTLLDTSATLQIIGGDNPTFSNISVALLGKNIVANIDQVTREYLDFNSVHNMVAIEDIFDDYYPILEQLVSADGWHFDLSAEISIGQDKYQLAQGSTFDFLYTNDNDFHLKANLVVNKWDGGAYQPFMTLNVVYLNDRLYIDYNGLKLTINKQALVDTYQLYDRLIEVVPQIGKLIDEMMATMGEAVSNSQAMDLSKLLTEASYNNGVFRLGINGGAILSKLGVITMEISRTSANDGLALAVSNVTYDNVTVHSFATSVIPQTKEQCLTNIVAPDTTNYYNLDSLYQLLSAFVTTADNSSFRIAGTVKAQLVVSVDIGVELYVDIDKDGFVYVTLQISRERLNVVDLANIAFVDYGGNSYLHFNGKDNTVTVIRDSYVKSGWFGTKLEQNNYYKQITTQEFTQDIVTYLMEMINFKQWIRDEITGAMTAESQGSDYEIVDLWTGYGYNSTQNGGEFVINTNLKPLDANLGAINVTIGHDSLYNLTYLNGDASLLDGWCKITFSLNHNTPEYGIATNYVTSQAHWTGVGTV